MTNEEKEKSLWYHFCTEKSCGGYDDCKLCPKAQVHPQLLEMAVWKEEQMIDYIYNHAHVTTFGDIRLEKCSVTQFIEDFKKYIERE